MSRREANENMRWLQFLSNLYMNTVRGCVLDGHTWFCLFRLSHCRAMCGWCNLWLRWRKRVEISMLTWVFCSHCSRSELEPINCHAYCRVIWPAFTQEGKPFTLCTKADCSQVLTGFWPVGMEYYFVEMPILVVVVFVFSLCNSSALPLFSAS